MLKNRIKILGFMTLIAVFLTGSTAYGETANLGHGDGCMHSHTATCYHQHISSCYHAHTSMCYQSHTHSSGCYIMGYHNVKNSSSSSSKGVINCNSCGHQWNGTYYISYCYTCFKNAYPTTCISCGRLCFYGDGVSNYVKDCQQSTCSKTQDLVCAKTTSTVVCGISMSTPKCGQGGTYSNCIMPTINYNVPSTWTNQDVKIRYGGTQSGTLTFIENGTQNVTITSSSGHRIRENITIDQIDKIAPSTPNYSL